MQKACVLLTIDYIYTFRNSVEITKITT